MAEKVNGTAFITLWLILDNHTDRLFCNRHPALQHYETGQYQHHEGDARGEEPREFAQ